MITRFKKIPYIFVLTLVLLGVCSGISAQEKTDPWVWVLSGQSVPANTAVGGTENGKPLLLCRANYNNGLQPGKIVAGQCNISWGGKEIVIRRFEVYTGNIYWDKKTRGLENAINAESENAPPLYLCRARLIVGSRDLGTHPGKVVSGRCNFGYGGTERLADDYEIGYDSLFLPLPAASQTYRIVSVRSGKVLDVRGPSFENGTVIQQWSDADVKQQQWQFEPTGDGYYFIRSAYSRKCLDVKGASVENGAVIQQWDCVGVENQKWKLALFENGFVLISKSSGKVIDLENASPQNGANILQWERHNGENQRWRLEKVNPALSLEEQCFNMVQGKVAWNRAGNKTWNEANVRSLCEETIDPNATIRCFTAEINRSDNWNQAIAACKPPTVSMVLGNYRREPVENDWHVGSITLNGTMLRWTNRAGVSWNLIPDFQNRRLLTDETNPYYKDGHREFKLILVNGQITGIEFIGEKYFRR